MVTKSLPDIEKAEKIVSYLTGAAFNFYFDRFTLDNAPNETAKIDELCKQDENLHLMMTK